MRTAPSQVFEANTARRSSIVRIGTDGCPVLCIEDFASAPDSLVELATEAHFIDVGPLYPGVRAPVHSAYVDSLLRAASADIERAFGATAEDELALCAYSMVTAPPAALQPVQRIPHYDGPESHRFAFIHYLCVDYGGTSFYRHRSTGVERVAPDRERRYRTALEAELRSSKPPPGYIRGDTDLFERTHTVEARFNRLLVYPGNVLHSGDIAPGPPPPEDPRRGRLTINGFGFLRS